VAGRTSGSQNPVVVPVSLSFVRASADPGYPGLKGRKTVVVVVVVVNLMYNCMLSFCICLFILLLSVLVRIKHIYFQTFLWQSKIAGLLLYTSAFCVQNFTVVGVTYALCMLLTDLH